ncbi:MAG: hypothetical protein ACM31C_22105 [Acidobacteriota bacterium]
MRLLALLLALNACTASQARRAQRVGELVAGGALVAMLGTIAIAAADPGPDTRLLEVGAMFAPLAIAGAAVYAAADSALTAPETAPASDHSRSWNAAMDLAKQAKRAARAGDCAQVQAIEPRVRELDSDVFLRFMRDKVIRTCLGPAPEP